MDDKEAWEPKFGQPPGWDCKGQAGAGSEKDRRGREGAMWWFPGGHRDWTWEEASFSALLIGKERGDGVQEKRD